MKLLSGNSHPKLSQAMAKSLGIELVKMTVSAFPDGETFVQINENIRGEDIYIIQPTCPPTNHNLMELLIIVDAARRASAGSITAVIPFFGYARQDRKDRPRVPITSKLVANLLSSAGVNRVVTMDLHAPQIQGFFDIPVDHLYASPILIEYMRKNYIENAEQFVTVSPDVGAVKRARSYAAGWGTPFAMITKERITATRVEATNLIGEVAGKSVILVDDMSETAGTLVSAAELLKSKGINRIFAVVTHLLLDNRGKERLQNSLIDRVITTDTTPLALEKHSKVEVVTVASLLAEAIARVSKGESVTSLFDILA